MQIYEATRDLLTAAAFDHPTDQMDPVKVEAFPAKFSAALDKWLPRFEAFITSNPDSDMYMVQGSPTFADVALAAVLKTCVVSLVIMIVCRAHCVPAFNVCRYSEIGAGFQPGFGVVEILSGYPGLTKLTKWVWGKPSIVSYLSSPQRYPLDSPSVVAHYDKVTAPRT